MNILKVAFRAGKDDYLDSMGHIDFSVRLLQPLQYPGAQRWLDSYAMGFEDAFTMAELTRERNKVRLEYGNLFQDSWFGTWHPLWGGHEPPF